MRSAATCLTRWHVLPDRQAWGIGVGKKTGPKTGNRGMVLQLRYWEVSTSQESAAARTIPGHAVKTKNKKQKQPSDLSPRPSVSSNINAR